MKKRIVLAFGTRPEAIKMAPVYLALARSGALEPVILLTGQHRTQLEQALSIFGVPHVMTSVAVRDAPDVLGSRVIFSV